MLAESDNMKTNKHTHHSRKEAPTVLFSSGVLKPYCPKSNLSKLNLASGRDRRGNTAAIAHPKKININLGFDAKRKEIKLLADVFALTEIVFALKGVRVGWVVAEK